MAKKVTGSVKLQIPAGKATPAPPVGHALYYSGQGPDTSFLRPRDDAIIILARRFPHPRQDAAIDWRRISVAVRRLRDGAEHRRELLRHPRRGVLRQGRAPKMSYPLVRELAAEGIPVVLLGKAAEYGNPTVLAGEPALCTHGEQLRHFLHVDDVADAFVGQHLERPGAHQRRRLRRAQAIGERAAGHELHGEQAELLV